MGSLGAGLAIRENHCPKRLIPYVSYHNFAISFRIAKEFPRVQNTASITDKRALTTGDKLDRGTH